MLHNCGRKDFSRISDIKTTPVSAHSIFLGKNGPTEENPEPIKTDPVLTNIKFIAQQKEEKKTT